MATAKKTPTLKPGDSVKWEFSMYIGATCRDYSGIGEIEGGVMVVASEGYRIRVTEVIEGHGSISPGSRVEAMKHRCELWPVGVHWPAPIASEPEKEHALSNEDAETVERISTSFEKVWRGPLHESNQPHALSAPEQMGLF
jgi:hypothetical protein